MKKPTPIVEIAATGRFLPDNIVTNDDLAQRLDTSDEWIRTRTGISERRIAPDDMRVADMGAAAARQAMERAEVEPGEVDILILSTATPDRWLPSTACDTQALLGCSNAVAFDVMAACSGFIYALSMAEGYLAAGRGEVALVIAAEKMTSIVDWEDRSTAVLFGDGAGAGAGAGEACMGEGACIGDGAGAGAGAGAPSPAISKSNVGRPSAVAAKSSPPGESPWGGGPSPQPEGPSGLLGSLTFALAPNGRRPGSPPARKNPTVRP